MVVWLAFINMMINWSVMKNTLFKRNTLLNKRSWMQTLTAAQTYFFLRGNKKRNLTCLSESTWIFTSCFCMFVLCEHETALNFCGTSWVWVSIFVFHNLLSVRWTDACLRSPQPHDAKTNTQHNDCFMLHFTPRFFFFASSFNFPFLMSLFFSFISLLQFISLSPYSIMSFSYAELSVISRALCATSASLFFYFSFTPSSAASLQSNSRSHNQALLPHRISCQKPVSFVSLDHTNIMAVSK